MWYSPGTSIPETLNFKMPKYGTFLFKCHSIDLDNLINKKISHEMSKAIFCDKRSLDRPVIADGKMYLNGIEIPDEILFGKKVPLNNVHWYFYFGRK